MFIPTSGNLLIQALGRERSWRVIVALRETGEAQTSHIAGRARMNYHSTHLALKALYEINIVKRRLALHLNGRGKIKPVWSLNYVHPATGKILALLDELREGLTT
jgi:hypothetical protein